MTRDLSPVSTPSIFWRYRPTSVAHSVYPPANLFMTVGSLEISIANCCFCRLWRWRTVISRMSAFSSLECRDGCWGREKRWWLVTCLLIDRDLMIQMNRITERGDGKQRSWDTYVFVHGIQDEGFQFIQAVIDPGSPPLFHDGLCCLWEKMNVNQDVQLVDGGSSSSRTDSLPWSGKLTRLCSEADLFAGFLGISMFITFEDMVMMSEGTWC